MSRASRTSPGCAIMAPHVMGVYVAAVIRNETSRTRRTVQTLYDNYASGRLADAVAMFSPSFEWRMHAPAHLLGVPPVRGQRAAFEAFADFRRPSRS
jgi:ketosteroid isomerase-like protein